MSSENISAEQLRLLIERIERLEDDKRAIADDIKEVFAEAKGTGFDTKTIRAIVKLRRLNLDQRREQEALLDTYKAALGMLDGTPLGRWAVERLDKDPSKQSDDSPAGGEGDDGSGPPSPATPKPALDVEAAKTLGREAARAGKPVTANPFPARDLRRAAWDEAWCGELGSDGMDISDALKPKKTGGATSARPTDDAE